MRDGAAALNVLMAVLDEIVYESATNLFFMCQVFSLYQSRSPFGGHLFLG
jgi:hypothetical protein